MTKRIKLTYGSDISSTAISNIFIDEYMADANGAYVKVYIYLLRCLGDASMAFSVASISEKLDETEKDIIRALKYWEKKKLLYISWDCDGQICGITINPLSNQIQEDNVIALTSAEDTVAEEEPEPTDNVVKLPTVSKPKYTSRQLARFKEIDDFNSLLDYIEKKFGCTMKLSDLQTPAFLYEDLGFSCDLIKYVYDYCFFKEKAIPAYIEKVAMSWNEKGIDTVDKARKDVFSRSKECAAVREAFGLRRLLGAIELEYVDRWVSEYGMTPEFIKEACNRTLDKIKTPDFKYANTILADWYNAGVKSMDDIRALDEEHVARSAKSSTRTSSKTAAQTAATPITTNKFNQFPQRKYTATDYAELEKRKLHIQ